VNNLVLVRNMVWNAWTIWRNLNAVDVKEINDTLYFLCADDGALYYLDPTSYQDQRVDQNGDVEDLGYETYAFSKRFDFGLPANPKFGSRIMVQGYITKNTKILGTVLFNEGGSIAHPQFVIDGSNTKYVTMVPLYDLGRVSIGQSPLGGSQIGEIGFFRCYLDIPHGVNAHTFQLKFATSKAGDNWGITGISANVEQNQQIPKDLVISIGGVV
jgi:hypothetical protein